MAITLRRRDRSHRPATPLAARFLAASGWDPPDLGSPGWADNPRSRAMLVLAQSVIVRTRFLDDLLAEAWAGGCRQVVILGAGLDTRAYRLPWPAESACFELDLPEILAFKDAVLSGAGAVPACRRIPLVADLLSDWTGSLRAAGFDPAVPTVWIAEGLLIYFSQEENDRLLEDIGTLSGPGHRLAITSSRPAGLAAGGAVPKGAGLLEDPGAIVALWRWDGPDDPVGWLAGHGWSADVYDREERAAAYGRPLALAAAPTAATRTLLIDARRA